MHDVTYQCNCKCKICDRWQQSDRWRDDLSLEAVFQMLEDAKKAGLINYVALGGEPLLRNNFIDILKHAKKLNFITSVITNGYYLKEIHDTLLPLSDGLIISLDSNDETHDDIRGLKGLQRRIIEGIMLCKHHNTKICLNTVLSRLNVDSVEGLVELSKKLDIPIVFQMMGKCKGYNEDILLNEEEKQKVFLRIIELKKAGYNIANSFQYLDHVYKTKSFVCHGPKYMIHVEANGDIISCVDILHKKWGNVKETKFTELFKRMDFTEFCTQVESCNECPVTCVIEGSLMYSLNPFYLMDRAFSSAFHYS
jgi:radical SAM protein with 4Fe4S-binding SPASM domain